MAIKRRNTRQRPHQNVRDTSKDAYYRLTKRQLNSDAKKVYDFLKENGCSTRRMISEHTGLKINHVTKAVFTLMDVWCCAIETEKKPCEISGRKAWYIDLDANLKLIPSIKEDKGRRKMK